MEEEGRYACSCRQDDSMIPDNLPEGYTGFVVNLWFRNKIERANGDDAMVLDSYRRVVYLPEFELMETMLLAHIRVCGRVNIPSRVKDLVIDKFLTLANSMLNNDKNAYKKKVLPIVVEVVVRTLQRPNESEQEVIARAFTECGDAVLGDLVTALKDEETDSLCQEASEYVAAIESNIKALEYGPLEVDDLSVTKRCVVCLDKFSVGMLVARVPSCSHVYHGNCIVHELVQGQSCLMCRYLACPCQN